MVRQPKGTTGLGAALDVLASTRAVTVAAASALYLSGLVVSAFSVENHLLSHVASGLLATGTVLFALVLPRRMAVGLGLMAGTVLIAAAALSPFSFLTPMPVATLTPVSALLVSMVRESMARQRNAQAALERHREDLEEALAISYRQVLYAEALSTAAQSYLAAEEQGPRDAALVDLCHATKADTVRVTRNQASSEQGLIAALVQTVNADRDSPWRNEEDVAWSRFPNVMAMMSSGNVHTYGHLKDIAYPDRHAYQRFAVGFSSGVDVPIMVDGRWEGTLSVGSHEDGRSWRDGELTLLRSFADMIGAAWGREHAVSRLGDAIDQRDHSLRLQAALTDSSRTLLESTSGDPLVEALEIVRTAVGTKLAYLERSTVGPEGPTRETMHLAGDEAHQQSRQGLWSSWPYAFGELNEGRPYIIDHIDQLPDRERAWYMVNNSPLRAELSFPVMAEGRLVAVVGLGHDRPRQWSASEMRMMGSVARMVGAYWQRDSVKQALEGLIRSKDRFIASVSHELRTPMAVVLGLSTELNTRRGDFTDEEAAEFIDLVARQAREVTHIIEDLLVSARATETSVTVIPEPIMIDLQVAEVLADLPSEHTFKVRTVDVQPAVVMADPVRTRQILRNLIINSHRHGGESVRIEGRTDGEFVRLRVSDDGHGVPEERREEIFEAYATSGERTGMTAAIGLGLTVSRQLARLMGGDVIYAKDDWSTFELSLPGVATRPEPIDQPERSALNAET